MRLIICLLVLFLLHCQQPSLSLTAEQNRFVDIYVELMTMKDRQSSEQMQSDSTEIILQKYNFTQEEYNRQIQSLDKDPLYWEAFFKAVKKKIDESNPPPPPS